MTPKKIPQINTLEDGLNPALLDKIGKKIDLKTSTTVSLLKQLAELLYTDNTLDGISEFYGQVLLEVDPEETSNYYLNKFMSIFGDKKPKTYKVRIPEIHMFLPIPSTFGETEIDKSIISLYPDFAFIPSSGDIDAGIAAGELVLTKFGNLKDFSDGKIVQKIGGHSVAQGTVRPTGASAPSEQIKEAFQGPPTAINNPNQKTVDAYSLGKPIGKIVVKEVQNGKLLREDAADAFIRMMNDARQVNINLNVRSAFRDNEEQTRIYNSRYKNGVLNEFKKDGITPELPAAKPGWSRHQNGTAIDIDVRKSFSSKEYLWLERNASKYNFKNSGKYFFPKEPHHWIYNSEEMVASLQEDDGGEA